ncbi:unnamed protein product [Calicophoron daubneyi]|uniref:F-box domain-containing protein n=1 Tax=Calicophoron daubneyi TaxID=300641 RepID=A0AAV2T6A2_CALDB
MQEDLPIELLQYVFMLLSPCIDFPNILNVCKRWREACLEVMKLRDSASFSAFRLEAPLRWTSPKVQTCNGGLLRSMPSRRFGSMVTLRGSCVYVFGGATNMFTTFNDLWIYDLSTLKWRRLLGEGELPTPRAHARGGFVGDILYLFGGCQSFHRPDLNYASRIEWLADLNSFDTKKLCWSRIPLCHVDSAISEAPPVTAGQSGCFLPAGDEGEPSLLILFGGISQSVNACVNSLCIIAPEKSQWFCLNEPEQPTEDADTRAWPAGRCGHSVCALDPHRMLVLFGNLESPLAPSFEPPEHSQRVFEGNVLNGDQQLSSSSTERQYRGRPARDIWILTRCKPQSSDEWFSAHWYWTEVKCSTDVPGCPPFDFYHASVVCLPYQDQEDTGRSDETGDYTGSNAIEKSRQPGSARGSYCIVCISQSTQQLIEEATKQRKHWYRAKVCAEAHKRPPSRSPYSSTTIPVSGQVESTTGTENSQASSPQRSGRLIPGQTLPSFSTLSAPAICENPSDGPTSPRTSQPPSPTSPSSVPPGTRRSADRRARQLEALAVQERRLFGARSSLSQGHADQSLRSSNPGTTPPNSTLTEPLYSIVPPGPTKPMAVYTLSISKSPSGRREFTPRIPMITDGSDDEASRLVEVTKDHFIGKWLSPKKPHFLDLIFGPQECLGFSCTFGHGCIFLFGGLNESDEVQRNDEFHPASGRDAADRALELDGSPGADVRPNVSRTAPSPPATRTLHSQFFILQARALFGTVV